MKTKFVLAVVVAGALFAAVEASAVNRTGGRGPDVLRGTPAADVLVGLGGDDRLIGGRGNDLLAGGRGRDRLLCGAGLDAAMAGGGDAVDPSCEVVVTRAGVRSTRDPKTSTPTAGKEQETESEDESADDPIMLAWLFPDEGDPDWTDGVVLFFLGVLGALVTAYLFLGEFLPSMGGKAEYDSDTWDLKTKKGERDKLIEERGRLARASPVNSAQVSALEKMSDDLAANIDQIEERRRSERWRLLAVGIPVYILVGGAFATIFATTFAQGLLIGFGWVAVADRLGLKKEKEARTDIREKEIEKLETEAEKRTEEAVKLKDEAQKFNGERRALEEKLTATDSLADGLREQLVQAGQRATIAETELEKYKEATQQLSRHVQELRAASDESGQASTSPQ